MKYSIYFSNILVHVLILSIFLTVFFFTIAVTVEKNIVKKQINFLIDDLLGNILKGLSPEKKNFIKNIINTEKQTTKKNESDDLVKKSNKAIIKKCIIFISILVIISFIILINIGIIFKWNLNDIKILVVGAIITLIFVAFTETTFLFLIASNYLSADVNKIENRALNILYNNRK